MNVQAVRGHELSAMLKDGHKLLNDGRITPKMAARRGAVETVGVVAGGAAAKKTTLEVTPRDVGEAAKRVERKIKMLIKVAYSTLKYFVALTYAIYMMRVILDQDDLSYMALCAISLVLAMYALFNLNKLIEARLYKP